MSGPSRIRGVVVILVMAAMGVLASASPTVVITSPNDGGILTDHSVDVSGTTVATNDSWSQDTEADFDAGSADSVVVTSDGTVTLGCGVQDDFDDGTINTSRWDVTELGGITVKEGGGVLRISGTVAGGGNSYSKYGRIVSDDPVAAFISAELLSFTGSGTGYRTHIFLLQDTANYVQIGQIKDSAYGGMVTEWGYTKGGVGSSGSLGAPGSGAHIYKISYLGGIARVYRDGVQKGSVSISLTDPVFYLIAAGKANGDTVNATWENATSGYFPLGTLTSSIHDTRCSPPLLTRVGWNDTTSSKTAVGLEVRSSDSSDMGSPTAWTQVTKGQTAGLPIAKRYLQYRTNLTSTDGTETPSLLDVGIRYEVSVARVDLSNDTITWRLATGTTSWTGTLLLPEGDSTVWARATDVRGGTNMTSIDVTVDTTPPSGSVLVEDGEPFTSHPVVNLTLDAADRFGVPEMMVSDSPDFTGATWVNFSNRSAFTVSGADGIKTVYVRFRDGNGLVSDAVNDTIVLDRQGPVGTVTIDGGAGYTNDTRLSLGLNATDASIVVDMMVGLSPALDGGTWVPFAGSASINLTAGDGERTVYARFRDVLGHVSLTVSDTIVLDTVPPQVTVSIDDGNVYTNSRLVTVTLAASDTSPVTLMQLGEGPDISGLVVEPLRKEVSLMLSEGDGTKTVGARVWDAAGNMGDIGSASIILDTTPPLVEVILAGGAGYTNARLVTIELRVTDEGVIQAMRLGEDPTLATGSNLGFLDFYSVRLSEGDGEKTLYVRVVDAAGNVGPISSDSIVLDTAPPVMGLSINDGAAYTRSLEVSVRLNVIERYGMGSMELSEDPSFGDASPVPFAFSATWTLSTGDGGKVLYVRGTDLAGNVGEATSASIVLDTTPPTLTLVINGGAGWTASTTVELQLALAEVNPTDVVEIDEGPSFANGETVDFRTSMTWTLTPGDGARTLYVRTTDIAGNVGPAAMATIVLDTTPPALTVTVGDGSGSTASREVTVTLAATDVNGMGKMVVVEGTDVQGGVAVAFGGTAPFTLSPGDGAKSLAVAVSDAAGNWCPAVLATVSLDTVGPATSIEAARDDPGSTGMTVSWTAVDATSGVRSYDVQYRDGDGPWQDLVLGTDGTSGVLNGRMGHTYYFRARATDNAGNVEAFPEDPAAFARVTLDEPVTFLGGPLGLALLVILVVAIVAAVVYYLKRTREDREGPPGTG